MELLVVHRVKCLLLSCRLELFLCTLGEHTLWQEVQFNEWVTEPCSDGGEWREEGRGEREEGRGEKGEGRGERGEGRGKKGEGRGKREEGRGKREEGRGKREEGRGKREEGRGKREEGRGKRKREEGRGKREEGRGKRKREEGRGKRGEGRGREGRGERGEGEREEGRGREGGLVNILSGKRYISMNGSLSPAVMEGREEEGEDEWVTKFYTHGGGLIHSIVLLPCSVVQCYQNNGYIHYAVLLRSVSG